MWLSHSYQIITYFFCSFVIFLLHVLEDRRWKTETKSRRSSCQTRNSGEIIIFLHCAQVVEKVMRLHWTNYTFTIAMHEFEENAWARNGRASAHNASRIGQEIAHTHSTYRFSLWGEIKSDRFFIWCSVHFGWRWGQIAHNVVASDRFSNDIVVKASNQLFTTKTNSIVQVMRANCGRNACELVWDEPINLFFI